MPKYLEDQGRVQFKSIPDAKVVFFAGAGISAESGLSTFRDKDGLWTKYDTAKVCSFSNYYLNKEEVFAFYNELKDISKTAEPNPAHKSIAELQLEFPDQVAIVTSNVDNLFEKAGCKNVLHVHGDFEHLSCTNCFHRFYVGDKPFVIDDKTPCPSCGRLRKLKPGVVLFGESALSYEPMINLFAQETVTDRVIIGTTLQVNRPEGFSIDLEGKSYYVDKQPNEDYISLFDEVIIGEASIQVPILVNSLRRKLLGLD